MGEASAWQASLGPYLTRQLQTGRYPTIARLVIDGAHLDAEEDFHRNLTTILDGITSRPRRDRCRPTPEPAKSAQRGRLAPQY